MSPFIVPGHHECCTHEIVGPVQETASGMSTAEPFRSSLTPSGSARCPHHSFLWFDDLRDAGGNRPLPRTSRRGMRSSAVGQTEERVRIVMPDRSGRTERTGTRSRSSEGSRCNASDVRNEKVGLRCSVPRVRTLTTAAKTLRVPDRRSGTDTVNLHELTDFFR